MTVVARLVRDRARPLVWWSAGVIGLVLFTVAFYPSVADQASSVEQLMDGLPEPMRVMAGLQEGIPLTSPAGYLHARLFATLGVIVVLVFAVGGGARAIGWLEESGQLEPLLANPVTRQRLAAERYAATVGLLTALVVVFAAAVALLAWPFGALDGVSGAGLAGACVALFGLALLHGTLAFAVGAVTGRRGPAVAVATAVAVAGYLVYSIAALAEAARPLRYLTPWQPYLATNMLADGPRLAPIAIPLVASAVLFGLGVVVFARRDLR